MSDTSTDGAAVDLPPENARDPAEPPPDAGWSHRRNGQNRRSLRGPLARLLGYYAATAIVLALLVIYFPMAQQALLSPLPISSWVIGEAPATQSPLPVEAPLSPGDLVVALGQRSTALLLLLVSCLLPIAPVTWVYMLTKRLRYDPSLVQSMILLPIVVAGILLVVQNSIAVAFGLVGIVAAVRFRNTLEDPKDAAYIFLTLGVGLAAGVRSLDVAMVMSLVFNLVVLTLWRFNIGSIYRGRYGRTGIFTMGQRQLWIGHALDAQTEIRAKLKKEAEDMEPDGILLVHTGSITSGRRVVEECLAEEARDWVLLDTIPRGAGVSTFEYLVRLKRRTTPAELLAELDERSLEEVASAEFIPYRGDS